MFSLWESITFYVIHKNLAVLSEVVIDGDRAQTRYRRCVFRELASGALRLRSAGSVVLSVIASVFRLSCIRRRSAGQSLSQAGNKKLAEGMRRIRTNIDNPANMGLGLPVARNPAQQLSLSCRMSIVMQNHGSRSIPGDYRDCMDYRESA